MFLYPPYVGPGLISTFSPPISNQNHLRIGEENNDFNFGVKTEYVAERSLSPVAENPLAKV